MDFEKFIEEVKSRIKDFLPEKYADAEIYVHEQKKINSKYTGCGSSAPGNRWQEHCQSYNQP